MPATQITTAEPRKIASRTTDDSEDMQVLPVLLFSDGGDRGQQAGIERQAGEEPRELDRPLEGTSSLKTLSRMEPPSRAVRTATRRALLGAKTAAAAQPASRAAARVARPAGPNCRGLCSVSPRSVRTKCRPIARVNSRANSTPVRSRSGIV